MLIERNPVRARQVKLGPVTASQVCFGTEHINRSVPEFGGTMQVTMSNGERLNVSRQYARVIKEKLGCL